jgi:hypothetical protein
MSPIQTQVLKLHEPLLAKSSGKKKKKIYQTPTKPFLDQNGFLHSQYTEKDKLQNGEATKFTTLRAYYP